ncbi:MAG: helix-turn-helix domain-containing protein [Candidatus Aenigmatarchaeota archaeon]
MAKTIQPTTIKKISRILMVLKTAEGEIHLSGIAKALNMKPMTVSRIIDNYLDFFVETRNIEIYGFKARLIKLKEGKKDITLKDVLDYLEVKKRIRGTPG